jgi:predicted MFS family arabinose efflux permease
MYSNLSPALGAGAGAGVLASTGFNSLWFGLAAFALIATGTAIMRIVPRRQRELEQS